MPLRLGRAGPRCEGWSNPSRRSCPPSARPNDAAGEQGRLGRTRPSRIHRIRQGFHFVGEDGFYVSTVDPWEPLKKLGHCGAVLEVLEQGGHRHPRPTEHPSPAELIRVPFNRRAIILVCHAITSVAWLSAQPRRGSYSIPNFRRNRLLDDVSLCGPCETCQPTYSSQKGWWQRQRTSVMVVTEDFLSWHNVCPILPRCWG